MYDNYITGNYDNITLTEEGFSLKPVHAGILVRSWLMQMLRHNDQEAIKGFSDSILEFQEGFYDEDLQEIIEFIKTKALKMSKDYQDYEESCYYPID